ncbi:MAG: efflux RND transporter periplasmic adaptor subunit [Desulfomonile tiedjei]|nr:efflux RND transporter periplasmic adaptor subunit [Desulfomonile tiedjei]
MNDTVTISKKTLKWVLIGSLIIVATLAIYFLRGSGHEKGHDESQAPQTSQAEQQTKSPVSGGHAHGLPARVESKSEGPVRYAMSEESKMLAKVQTAAVKREKAVKKLRMVGMVFDAETRVATLTARIDGRLDQVFIDFTGVKVNKGDPMVTVWSPTLIKSQVELFESIRSKDEEGVIRGAEEKLKQYGMTTDQVTRIRESKKPELYVTLRAPINGIVMEKKAVLGQFVKEGQDMFVINDLSHVWVKLDAYEPDLPWIRYGQEVTFTTPSFPGKTFKGKVIFIEPVLEMGTRTIKVRVDAENPDYELKPHMFVNAELEAEVDDQGRVIKPEWVGKYICPFDPKEVSDVPGTCPKTQQPLQPASAYGYSGVENPVLPLIVPETAVLFTGKRSLVYVEVPNQKQPTYEQRDVVLGPRAGNKYVISGGLKEGERVVVKGNFEIDSSVQISGQPSMMNPVEANKGAPSAPEAISAGPELQTNHTGHETPEQESKATAEKAPAMTMPPAPDAHAGHGTPEQESKAPVKKAPEAEKDPHSAHGKEGQ